LARLLAASARLALLDVEPANNKANAVALLQRLLTVASPIRLPNLDTIATLCHGLYLARWSPETPELFQLVSWISQLESSARTAPQAMALRFFALSVLATPEGRLATQSFGPDLRRTLARAVTTPTPMRRLVVSDTTLKLRHEVAEVLRRAGRPYDLEVSLCPGLGVDLTLLRRGGRGGGDICGASSALWLLDGPESFHRPFVAVQSDATDAGRSKSEAHLLRLVPAEVRRAEILSTFRCEEEASRLKALLREWGGGEVEQFGRAELGPLARLHWLEWAAMSPQARLAALTDASARAVVR